MANLLQALELTNGNLFNNVLDSGAKKWKEQYKTSEELVESLYMRALGRGPNVEEMKVALNTLGTSPNDGAVEDFIWAIMLLPEFQLIY